MTLDLAASFEAAGVHSLALDVNNFGGSTGVVSVSVEAGNGILAHDQVYTFVVKYQDVALNPPAEVMISCCNGRGGASVAVAVAVAVSVPVAAALPVAIAVTVWR